MARKKTEDMQRKFCRKFKSGLKMGKSLTRDATRSDDLKEREMNLKRVRRVEQVPKRLAVMRPVKKI